MRFPQIVSIKSVSGWKRQLVSFAAAKHLYRGIYMSSVPFVTPEPFVSVEAVAEFLDMPRPQVLRLTRDGVLRAHPVSGSKRLTRKYRLSEVAEDIACLRQPARASVSCGSPRSSAAKEKKHGTE